MTLTEYLLNLALIGIVVVQLRGRRLSWASLLWPIAIVAWVAAHFLRAVPTAGNDVTLELTAAVTGALLGSLAGATTRILPGADGVAVARAGAVAAALWVVGVGSRLGFALFAQHGGGPAIVRFSAGHHITSGQAWVAAFILMAIAEVAARTAVLFLKARRSGARLPRLVPARAVPVP